MSVCQSLDHRGGPARERKPREKKSSETEAIAFHVRSQPASVAKDMSSGPVAFPRGPGLVMVGLQMLVFWTLNLGPRMMSWSSRRETTL